LSWFTDSDDDMSKNDKSTRSDAKSMASMPVIKQVGFITLQFSFSIAA
jgi:hypothetical protein